MHAPSDRLRLAVIQHMGLLCSLQIKADLSYSQVTVVGKRPFTEKLIFFLRWLFLFVGTYICKAGVWTYDSRFATFREKLMALFAHLKKQRNIFFNKRKNKMNTSKMLIGDERNNNGICNK